MTKKITEPRVNIIEDGYQVTRDSGENIVPSIADRPDKDIRSCIESSMEELRLHLYGIGACFLCTCEIFPNPCRPGFISGKVRGFMEWSFHGCIESSMEELRPHLYGIGACFLCTCEIFPNPCRPDDCQDVCDLEENIVTPNGDHPMRFKTFFYTVFLSKKVRRRTVAAAAQAVPAPAAPATPGTIATPALATPAETATPVQVIMSLLEQLVGQLAGMMVLMLAAVINLFRRFNQLSTSTKTLLLIQLLICSGGHVSSHCPISQCIGSTLVINPNDVARGEEFYLADITRTSPQLGYVVIWYESKITRTMSDRVKYLHHESCHNLLFMITNLKPSDAGWYRMDVVLTGSNLYKKHRILLEIYDCDTEKPTTVLGIEEDRKQLESGKNTNELVNSNEDVKTYEINPGDKVEQIQNIGNKLEATTNILLLIVGLLIII